VRVLRSPLDAISCTVLPASCTLSGSLLPHFSSVPICDACWAEIPFVADKQVLLVDDTLATGTVPRAAAQSLIKAGAAAVYVATLARARRSSVSDVQLDHKQTGVTPAIAGTLSSSSIYQPSS